MIGSGNKICILFLITFMLFMAGCTGNREKEIEQISVNAETPEKTDETIKLFALGDNLLHMPVVNSGKNDDGTYSYPHLFDKLQPDIKNADIAVIGQETVFGGEKYGYSGYPLFNSPSDMGETLVEEGFDIVLHASNHILDKTPDGVLNTLEFWKKHPDVLVLGINSSEAEKETVRFKKIKGADIAFLNYTYSTNGIVLPSDKKYLVNYIDEEKIKKDSCYAEENADFTVAFMHWGTEYSIKPDSNQKALSEKMCEWGVDLIIGSHPHVIEPVEWIESENGNEMLVYYSLGNFVSRQKEARNLLGGVADVSLKYDGEDVFIDEYSFIPIVTHYDDTSTKFSVFPLKKYSDELASQHGIRFYDGNVSIKRWTDMLFETFFGYDTSVIDID